jgi:hypothetical protein
MFQTNQFCFFPDSMHCVLASQQSLAIQPQIDKQQQYKRHQLFCKR